MATAHTVYGGSAAARFMACPGSIELGRDIDAPSSTYAIEGTDAGHAPASICLAEDLDAADLIGRRFGAHVVTKASAAPLQFYLDEVRGARCPGDTLLVERRVDLGWLDPPVPMFGTADAILIQPWQQTIQVFDLKWGRGVRVSAKGNAQLRFYALGALGLLPGRPVATVATVIVQPRIEPAISSETLTSVDLIAWAHELLDAVDRTLEPDAPLNPGPWCRFCPAAGICPARHARRIAAAQAAFAESAPP